MMGESKAPPKGKSRGKIQADQMNEEVRARLIQKLCGLCLHNDGNWSAVLQQWGTFQGQQDSAEFAHQALTWLSSDAFDMRWERIASANITHTMDVGSACFPIILQFCV